METITEGTQIMDGIKKLIKEKKKIEVAIDHPRRIF